jgi:hypothetical protein
VRLVGTGRRGLWMRYVTEDPGAIELCAGREGDDSYARLATGFDAPPDIRIAYKGFVDLLHVLQTAKFALAEENQGWPMNQNPSDDPTIAAESARLAAAADAAISAAQPDPPEA